MAKYIVGRVADLPAGTIQRIEVGGRAVAVFNVDGAYYALRDICPHRGARLSGGAVVRALSADAPGEYCYDAELPLVKCPWHGWEFALATGQSWFDPTKQRVRAYAVRSESGAVLSTAPFLVSGPYVAETFAVSVEDDYVVLEA